MGNQWAKNIAFKVGPLTTLTLLHGRRSITTYSGPDIESGLLTLSAQENFTITCKSCSFLAISKAEVLWEDPMTNFSCRSGYLLEV